MGSILIIHLNVLFMNRLPT